MRTVRVVFMVLLFSLLFAGVASAAPRVVLDGKELTFDVPPVIDNGRTLVPLRAIFEALGASVEWDGASNSIIAAKDSLTINLTVGSQVAVKNGAMVALDAPAKIIDGRTLVPLRFIGEALGCQVSWDGVASMVTITTKTPETPREIVKNDKINELIVHPENFIGNPVDMYGQVCRKPEPVGANATGYLVWLDPDKKTINAYVVVQGGAGFDLNDYVRFQGTITGRYDAPNYYVLHGIYIKASSIAKASDIGPSSTITPNASGEQDGLSITVTRVDFGDQETRVYLDVKNTSTSPAHIYDLSAQLFQGSKQFSQKTVTSIGYQVMKVELFHNDETSGYLAFEPVDYGAGGLQFVMPCKVNGKSRQIEVDVSWPTNSTAQ